MFNSQIAHLAQRRPQVCQSQPAFRGKIPPLHLPLPRLGEVDVQREARRRVGGLEGAEGGGEGVVVPVADGVEEEDLVLWGVGWG